MKVSDAVERYLLQKRANGLSYKTQEFALSGFRRYVGDLSISDITPKQVAEFLSAREVSNKTRLAKHCFLRMFFEFWTDRGYMSLLSMPLPQKRNDQQLPTPFVYTREEIRRLMHTHGNQAHALCAVSETTFRTILLTLYGTGALTSEILWLRRDDLDLRRNLIFLRGNRVVLARKVPLGKELHRILAGYLQSEERRGISCRNVFVSKHGGPLKNNSLVYSFARLRTRAGVLRVDGVMRKPCMRDLRQTFAVHRIASWISEGADLNRMLPALSAYMGFAGFRSTQTFLFMTPERFKRELDELSPYKTTRPWRDDLELMKFLAGL